MTLQCPSPRSRLKVKMPFSYWLRFVTKWAIWRLSLILLCSTCLLHVTTAWSQNSNGTLRGEVQDISGARLAGANVRITASGSSMTRDVTANNRGEFRVEGLLPGQYRVAVSAQGFADAVDQVSVAVSVVRDLSVTLQPQTGRELVTVSGKASSSTTEAIDTASAVPGGVVTSLDLQM